MLLQNQSSVKVFFIIDLQSSSLNLVLWDNPHSISGVLLQKVAVQESYKLRAYTHFPVNPKFSPNVPRQYYPKLRSTLLGESYFHFDSSQPLQDNPVPQFGIRTSQSESMVFLPINNFVQVNGPGARYKNDAELGG